ncbi:winged helix-turn-helix domain-containing protein [Desulfovibrio litoralis]|uniref:Molybdate transport system regulatory protein n=1 Tax=Desulfovibrio litoralis DSM 11393 TaxID=1121455 RepID=A0A1M7SAP0_9BACT|nr:LysR family transcriptional regulator [Desulfovibrio litoralis]SHN55580.1 molybdate transport system regulatory protein [Desulfovibrio litoralis DSM 11393]
MSSILQDKLKTCNHQLKIKVWLTSQDQTLISPGLVELLCLINAQGSLQSAAKQLSWSYRMAWGRLRKAEEHLGFSLVEKHSGNKGGLVLSQAGLELIEKYQALMKNVQLFAEEQMKNLFLS